jgi:two-component system chemotaxis sensor kinase CheA
MMDDDLDERLEMVKDFVNESRDILDDVEPQIIAMEKESFARGKVDQEILNTIFRLFHTLKGTASFLDLQTVINVTHEAETLLDIFRKGKAGVGSQHVDLLYRTSDFIRNILDTVETELSDEGLWDGAQAIIADLQKSIVSTGEKKEKSGCQPVLQDNGAFTPTASLEEMRLVITPEMVRRFIEESLELCDEAEGSLLLLEKNPHREYAAEAFRALHSLKGNAGFFGYPDIERIGHLAETVLEQMKNSRSGGAHISALLTVVDALRSGIKGIAEGGGGELPGREKIAALLGNLLAAPFNHPEEEKAIMPGDTYYGNGGEKEPAAPEKASSCAQQVIRVDIEKLDKLLDLVGELVIAEAMVANNQQGLRSDRFEKAVLQLDKITREIQEVSMSMRMVPLAGTFRKMERLVRDLSHRINKAVHLEMVGAETEVDKTIIEQISDPLVHIIRNAVDHGIESPGDRRAAGKSEAGRIRLEAKHSAGEVWIMVEDDGRGLNRERILQKAAERGLVKNNDRELKDEEVWQLIFEPGFSTAEEVSNISGRGVGMDVVRRNIEKLRGKVDIRSREGAGTVFAVRIPLTLAIIEGMVVRVGQNRYTIPISSIIESFQPEGKQITGTPDGLEVVHIRGALLPVIRLHQLYKVSPRFNRLEEGILIVVESDERKCCLFVDELVGQQQIVIKGLSSYFGHVKSLSGCAILGDGDISMIMDISNLIKTAENVAV